LEINQILIEKENIEKNLVEDYEPDWRSKFNPVYQVPENAEALIEQIKNDLKELGPVNIAAIDDYEQVKQRYEFLWNQSQDLIKAKESLEKVIKEIEGTITKRFIDTFQQIKKEFTKIFGELFEGGNADLYLIDPEQPLESGIEIVAQPPGKKLQSLSLLSGGERAMTAIALLFAILAVKPSPFCILDEIDATLDEVNVQRFSHLLELFSKKLQFIVVTHRRGTMEVANALYGVTMQEHGVSKLISLDLNEKVG
jgi:chromosome segregation protein